MGIGLALPSAWLQATHPHTHTHVYSDYIKTHTRTRNGWDQQAGTAGCTGTSRDSVYLAHKRLSLACWVSYPASRIGTSRGLEMPMLGPAGWMRWLGWDQQGQKKKGTPTLADVPFSD